MKLRDYQSALEQLGYGKRLPNALYVYWDRDHDLGGQLQPLIDGLAERFDAGPEFNLIKFRTDELKLSFLSYPGFLSEAHPALRHAITIDLAAGRARHTDYADNLNPPILHRKESFLPADHPRSAEFAALTQAEQEHGLYANATTIGFRLNWEKLLEQKGLQICDHELLKCASNGSDNGPSKPQIDRHRTALTRYDLSKPVKSLLEYGVLRKGNTFFDYGCGQGSDVRGLQALNYEAEGWDPVHSPHSEKKTANVVNLGYVLNVIEDPAERVETLVDAYHHTQEVLVVSALIRESVEVSRATAYGDGVITQRNTFQKFFDQQELQQFIEDALHHSAVPVSLGIFYVFKDPTQQQDFLSARSRRSIDWGQISARLGLGRPTTLWKALYEAHKDLLDPFGTLALELGRFPNPAEYDLLEQVSDKLGSLKRALRAYVQGGGIDGLDWDSIRSQFGVGQPRKRRWEALYEENTELLDAFWETMLKLGRLPEPEEFDQIGDLHQQVGTPKQALRIFLQKGGADDMAQAEENRRRDLLVYVALANLQKRVPLGHLSKSLRADIKAFFGNYKQALEKGLELLYAAGDPGEIEVACEELEAGWQDEQALYIHRSVLEELPPVLRAYVGCATTLIGDLAQADLIKLHKASGKVTFLVYEDFDGKPLPELHHRIKVNLRTRWVQVFDHKADGQLLYYKERFVSPTHPAWASMEKFSAKLRKLGIEGDKAFGPNKVGFAQLCEDHGLNENLNAVRTKTNKASNPAV